MANNMIVFNDNETHTEIRYVIARFEKSRWYHFAEDMTVLSNGIMVASIY